MTHAADAIDSGWKLLTHDWCSPLQGGPPLVTGPLPVTLPRVALDTGPADCAAGWHYCADIATAWQIAGMWPTGRPARVLAVQAVGEAIERGGKRRAASLTLLREATAAELTAAFAQRSAPFGIHAASMAAEQQAWHTALSRTGRDAAAVEGGLLSALAARGLPWRLKRSATAR